MITADEKYRAAVALAQIMLKANYSEHVAYHAVAMAEDIARRVMGPNPSPAEKTYYKDRERWRLEQMMPALKDIKHG